MIELAPFLLPPFLNEHLLSFLLAIQIVLSHNFILGDFFDVKESEHGDLSNMVGTSTERAYCKLSKSIWLRVLKHPQDL